jgi:hypothetical protein
MKWLIITLMLAAPALADEGERGIFPPGEGADLANKACTRCHGATVVVTKHYDNASAAHYWKTMVGTDPDSAEARAVIAYLVTVLNQDDAGPDGALR